MLLARCSGSIASVSVRAAVVSFLALSLSGLAGCGIGTLADSSPAASTFGSAFNGSVHGGQQPVTGSHVYLFAAGSGGYGTSAASVLTTHANTAQDATGVYVLSDANGNFDISNDYACPSPSSQMYILAKGGSPSPGITNSAIALIAALGTCSNLSASTKVIVNEVTTVAAAYALSGFITDSTHVASASTALSVTNIASAFATANNIADSSTGAANAATTNGAGVVPNAEINTIANIIAACVNSSDQSSACQSVASTVTPPSGVTIPGDTFGIAINFSKYPTLNVNNAFNFNPAIGPFQPTLATPPNDWTIAVYYPLPATGIPGKIAVDGDGSIWAPVCPKFCSGSVLGVVHHYTNLGVPLSGAGFSTGIKGTAYVAAIDTTGAVYLPGNSNNFGKINSDGTIPTGWPKTTDSSIGNPTDAAIDGNNYVWFPNPIYNNFGKFGLGGGFFSSTSPQFIQPSYAAVDSTGVAWCSGYSTNQGNSGRLMRISGTPSSPNINVYDLGANVQLSDILITQSPAKGVAGLAGNTSQTIYLTNADGSSNGTVTFPGPSNFYYRMTQDGGGGLYVNSGAAGVISATRGARINPGNTGLLSPALSLPGGMGVDGAGNLWLVGCTGGAACQAGSGNSNALFEFIGLAYPTITPLVAATSTNRQGMKP